MKVFRAAVLLLIGFASCTPSKDLVYQSVQNFKLQKTGLDKTILAMDVGLYNPNKQTIKLKKATVDVYLNDTRLGRMGINGKYTVSKLDTFLLPVLLELDLKNSLTNAFQLLTASDMNVRLTGTIKAGKYGFYRNVPVNYEGKQNILGGMKLW